MNYRGKRAVDISVTVAFCFAVTLFILTLAIGVPIYCRFLYYLQIKTLKLEETTGWSYSTIKAAYDEVLDFLLLPGKPFGTGELKWTESEAAHFADCKVLFTLNTCVLAVSGALALAAIILNKFKVIRLCRPFGHRAYLISAVCALALPLIVGALAAVNFEKAFEVFHKIFFPGKTNWTFDPNTEQIIQVMPEQFFMNCAIIIGVVLVAFSSALLAADIVVTIRDKKRKKEEITC